MINIDYLKTFYIISFLVVGGLFLFVLPTILAGSKHGHKRKSARK